MSPSRVRIAQVVYWQHFEASEWDIVYDVGKLASHGISDWEAEEVIFNMFVARPNKKVHVRTATSWRDEQMLEGRYS